MKVTIERHDGRLRLRWQHLGKRYTLSLGVKVDPLGLAIAQRGTVRWLIGVSCDR